MNDRKEEPKDSMNPRVPPPQSTSRTIGYDSAQKAAYDDAASGEARATTNAVHADAQSANSDRDANEANAQTPGPANAGAGANPSPASEESETGKESARGATDRK